MNRFAVAGIKFAARTRSTIKRLVSHPPLEQRYVTSAPEPSNALEIFKGAWSSKLPSPLEHLKAGPSPLFDDERIHWFIREIGGAGGKSALDLGPLEGGHSYMLEKMGATRVTGVEANTHAYLRCLIIKEILHLERVEFLCGDFVEYLRMTDMQFDLCIASGVLYHMRNPAELIALIAKRCNKSLFLWTHYYNADLIAKSPIKRFIHKEGTEAEYGGFNHMLYRYEYQQRSDWATFCGGSAPYSNWMTRLDIMECLKFFGFHDIRINFDMPNHQNGPAIALAAFKR